MDPASLAAWGLPGLFLAAFLAGSILPFPSELVLVLLVSGGVSPGPVVLVATVGNVLGALSVLVVGAGVRRGAGLAAWIERRTDPEALERARERLDRFGPPLLVFAFVPIAGDALVLAAGLLRLRWAPCVAWLSVGKFGRYALLAWATLSASA